MANYLARVEVFNASGEDYENLHKAMSAYGFERYIDGHKGKSKLPDGLYVGTSYQNPAAARDRILEISRPFSSKTASVFVCVYDDWAAHLYP
ncbi:DUF2622 domain-containing protein [Rosenbergiella epipactidis]|uniref:DUF2622 domain-containing protein n=1 Tax=Rosenbergiella epipactidis TaxID=1544694 RepID=UPI001F4DB629|nr:DUF2622 domain-containing protein [Rosenbergiella epipactidis]